jgi:GNAT superfamily N-acetyltransferase
MTGFQQHDHNPVVAVVPSTELRYPEELACDATTTLGTTLHVRPIRPDDASNLVAFHKSLSARSVYRRFFSAHPTLSDAEVERFTNVDYVNRLALVAEDCDRLVSVARYDRAPGSLAAEVAFVVADEYQHRGIATLLLELLASAAWRSGITTFFASTLAENREMLGVFLNSRFDVTTNLDEGIIYVCFPIGPTCNRHAPQGVHYA